MKNSTKKSGEKTFGFNEVMSLLESMNDGIKVISEQYGGVVARLDKVDDRLNKMDNRLDKMDNRLNKMDNRLDKMDNRLNKMDNRLGKMDNRLERIEVKVDKLQDDMVEVKYEIKNKVDRDEFKKLEKRVVKLERLSCLH